MRLSVLPQVTQIGNVYLHELYHVCGLDSAGPDTMGNGTNDTATQRNIAIRPESIYNIEKQLAIVIPVMNEDLSILDGVLAGVPASCLVILISNSNKGNFIAERESLYLRTRITCQNIIVLHQGEPSLACAFLEAGRPEMILRETIREDEREASRIRNGKGEAMMLGVIAAKLQGRKFVGFIDGDNRVPGSVLEYCKVFAAGLHHALHSSPRTEQDPDIMVRIKWKSKPKIIDGKLVLEPFGRSSRVVNRFMNRFVQEVTGKSTPEPTVLTANAGEHAMNVDLALHLRFATGYAVEPYQLIDLWEQSSHQRSQPPSPARNVRILQIETCNPHIHDTEKGAAHIERMQAQGLSTIYYSRLTLDSLKDEIRAYMKNYLPTNADPDGQPGEPRVYPALQSLEPSHWKVFAKVISGCEMRWMIDRHCSSAATL